VARASASPEARPDAIPDRNGNEGLAPRPVLRIGNSWVTVTLERVWGEAAVRFRLLAENSDPDARQ
jgi:hypothetical protein